MTARVIAAAVAALAWLSHVHLTLGTGRYPLATIPALYAVALFAAALTAALAAFVWRTWTATGGTLAWRAG